MNLAIGSDHAGFDLKQRLADDLRKAGHSVTDVGADSDAPSDYPDFAEKIAKVVLSGQAERGILICGSGVGASVAANKIPGIRAGLCHDHYSAHQGVEHDNTNVLVIGARIIGIETARDVVNAFLSAKFSTEERHRRRVGKIADIEKRYSAGAALS